MSNITHTWNTQALWQGGSSLTNIDTVDYVNSITFGDAGVSQTWNNALTGWTTQDTQGAGATLSSTGTGLVVGGTGSNYFGWYQTNGTQFGDILIGDWVIPYNKVNENLFQIAFTMGFITTQNNAISYRDGYWIELFNSNISLVERFLGGNQTVLASAAVPATSGTHTVRIRRSSIGQFFIFLDNTLYLTATNNDFNNSNTGTYFGYATSKSPGNTITLYANGQGPTNFLTPSGATTAQWISDTINFGSPVGRAWLPYSKSETLNGGTTTYYTRSSNDGISFDPWIAVSGTTVGSVVRQYAQTRVDFATSNGFPIVSSITLGTKSSHKASSMFLIQ